MNFYIGKSGLSAFVGVAFFVVSSISHASVMMEGATDDVVLWPSAKTRLCAQPDSAIAMLPDGSMGVTTGIKYSWPGVRMDFLSGECDLSQYGVVTITVSNTTSMARSVQLSVKGHTLQGRTPGGSVEVPPHTVGKLEVYLRNMPWALNKPVSLQGMCGYPYAVGSGTTFDLRRLTSFHVFLGQNGEPGGFSVHRISVSGSVIKQKKLSAETFFPFVDRFGQFMHDDWPGKVHDDADLDKARCQEEKWLEEHSAGAIVDADRYGGWMGGPQLTATGFFRTEKIDGKWWLVDPDGRLFFSHGVNCVGVGADTGVGFRESYFAWLPAKDDSLFGKFYMRQTRPAARGFYNNPSHVPYDTYDFPRANALRKYGANWWEVCAERAHVRIRAWGLNTIANWSDPAVCGMRKTPYTLCLGTYGTPRLKGSMGWGGALPDPFNPDFERIFRGRVREAAKKMRDDPWCIGVFVDNEPSWNSEPRMEEVSEKYFSTVRNVLKEELPNHLYLGCRIAWGSDAVLRAASRYCDVVSVNVYSRQPVRDLPEKSDDKPMLIGEFHFGALDRGMFHTGLVAARDQAERAVCYRTFVEGCLDHPRFVGTHWFQWRDQALTGRADGENFQIGFVSVTDAPYPELVQAAREVGAVMYSRRFYGFSRRK